MKKYLLFIVLGCMTAFAVSAQETPKQDEESYLTVCQNEPKECECIDKELKKSMSKDQYQLMVRYLREEYMMGKLSPEMIDAIVSGKISHEKVFQKIGQADEVCTYNDPKVLLKRRIERNKKEIDVLIGRIRLTARFGLYRELSNAILEEYGFLNTAAQPDWEAVSVKPYDGEVVGDHFTVTITMDKDLCSAVYKEILLAKQYEVREDCKTGRVGIRTK